jgi:soluble lytic murein transglycosylase-like protein
MTIYNPSIAAQSHQSLGLIARLVKAGTPIAANWVWRITHNGFAMAGLGIVCLVALLVSQEAVREPAEEQLLDFLQSRQETRLIETQTLAPEPNAADRASVASLSDLPEHQAMLTRWISRQYRVAAEPMAVLVAEAHVIGERMDIDPALLLAIMAVESRFNPFAQSPVGAQGLMQVLTRVHLDKFEDFGGKMAAFDPITNLRVGAMVLQECIRRAAGSVEGGLSYYVGAVTVDGSFYVKKVLRVYERMHKVLAPFDLPSYKRSLTLSSDKPALPAVSSPSAPVKPFSRPQTPTQSPNESTAGTQLQPNMEPPVHSQQTSSTLLAQQLPPVQ